MISLSRANLNKSEFKLRFKLKIGNEKVPQQV